MRTDISQRIDRDTAADDERRRLAADPNYVALTLPDKRRTVYILRSNREVVRLMTLPGRWKMDGDSHDA